MYANNVYENEQNSGNVPAFLMKLWTLVEDHSTDDLIYWGQNGTSFHIHDQNRFSREVLPRYFKHNNIASFIRQLNMYGFRKVVNVDQGALKVDRDDLEFHHTYFQQGQEQLLENIKRKVSNSNRMESVKLKQEDVSKVLTDVRCLKGRQDGLTNKLDLLKRENEALWREVASLQQKHMKQQQIVNKVIQFLVTLVRGNQSVTRKRKTPLMLSDSSHLDAKIPRTNSHLSIEPKSFEGPSSANTHTTRGPIIHDVTDSFLQNSGVLLEEISSSDLEDLVSGGEKNVATTSVLDPVATSVPKTVVSSSVPVTTVTSVQPTYTTNTTSSYDKDSSPNQAVQTELDVMQMDLDSLKDLFAGQYSIDPNLVMGIFTPDVSMNQSSETILDSLENSAENSNSNNDAATNILGNELIQYQPPEDLPNLFDFGDVYDGDLNHITTDTDFISDSLLTPDCTPVSPSTHDQTSLTSQVKTEEVD
ncbi:heat shock factor protein 1-like isoform X2 [Gigantopelta aegis]|uniref:heat shock factor protein 1-like isoform X2 n=1 Tax=Gigantopelta aegis TaxID=1735272 RepID=UPI001B888604|nr:heat shock factor protein 1-like isoform X2 [Gigantopelta aegis]